MAGADPPRLDPRDRPEHKSKVCLFELPAELAGVVLFTLNDHSDIDGNIRALQEKIQEGVCPELFERRLRPYIEEKQRQE